MGAERCGLGEFQGEAFIQTQSYLMLDLLCFFLWPDKSQAKIIGIATIPESSLVRVVGVNGGKCSTLLFQAFDFFHHSLLASSTKSSVEMGVDWIGLSAVSSCGGRHECLLDKGIEFAEARCWTELAR
jgi:hypothetical protein